MSLRVSLQGLRCGLRSSRRDRTTRGPGARSRFATRVEALEDRSLPSTFTVLNLNESGAGSLRQAILNANGAAGADLITFAVAGTIRLTSGALPAVTDKVDIDGRTEPGFAGTPVVEVD